MTIKRLIQAASITGVAIFMMAGSASATVTYTTNVTETGFTGGGNLFLGNTSGNVGSTLTFVPQGDTVGEPTNINYGIFTLACALCSTEGGPNSAIFSAFTFDLVVSSQGTMGRFTGTSAGGTVWSNVSTINIDWTPLQLGPGTTNAFGGDGNFGTTFFTINSPTGIVAPNSGTTPGQTTVQGAVADSAAAIPEPATLGLISGGLLALGLLRRKKVSHQ